MEDPELTRKVLEKVDECPNCHAKLVQRSTENIRCRECGLNISVESGKTRYAILALCCVVLVGLVAFVLGTLANKHV